MTKYNPLIFTLFLLLILWSGIHGLLGYRNLALWPWSQQWYMFSYSSNYLYKLRVVGYTNDNISTNISLGDYFSYPVNLYNNRADEMSRASEDILKLAEYICQKNPKFTDIIVYDDIYLKQPGRIPYSSKTPDFVRFLVDPTPCQS